MQIFWRPFLFIINGSIVVCHFIIECNNTWHTELCLTTLQAQVAYVFLNYAKVVKKRGNTFSWTKKSIWFDILGLSAGKGLKSQSYSLRLWQCFLAEKVFFLSLASVFLFLFLLKAHCSCQTMNDNWERPPQRELHRIMYEGTDLNTTGLSHSSNLFLSPKRVKWTVCMSFSSWKAPNNSLAAPFALLLTSHVSPWQGETHL